MIRRLAPILAFSMAATACSALTGADLTTTSPPSDVPPDPSSTSTPGPPADPALAIVPTGGTDLHSSPAGPVTQTVHEGIILPVTQVDGLWLEIVDSCSNPGWVSQNQVEVVDRSTPQEPGPGFEMSQAVVVVDAGHGGRDWGAPGQDGTRESFFNLDIADRLRNLLLSSHDIDWVTGEITDGDTYGSISGAYMTRDTIGPDDGDFEAGLAYRATIANSVSADAMVAVHNNTGTDRTLQDPPRAVFYALSVDDSDRLASLIDEELWRAFDPFSGEWQGSAIQGTASRRDVETGSDFYGLLRRSEVPSVIVEGVYVSDPAQNLLLQTPEFRQAYAEGVYLGLVRFLTTTETGTEINEPIDFQGNVGSPNTTSCVVPEQD